jgi:hypothetical protein
MATTSPALIPPAGLRALSAKEQLQRAAALNCVAEGAGKPACVGQVFVGIFFDGTGNNKKLDFDEPPPEKRKHTNIVKLFQAFRDDPGKGYFRFYVPGVGTPFPEIGEMTASANGARFALRAEDRIIWAFTRLINAPHQYVFGNAVLIKDDQAKAIVNNLASSTNPAGMRRLALQTWQDKLKAALQGKKPEVKMINLSVFGFSRGAAQARAFANWLFEVCTPEGSGWTFAGIPIRLQFLGIFDTVASVGLTNLMDNGVLRGHQSWADDNMEIHPAIEQCMHYVAAHEVRACFPLDSVRVKSTYPSNAVEVMYPGAHSDVGGGYAAGDLGVSLQPQDSISIIPGLRMYQDARKSGVPLVAWGQLDKQFQDNLTPSSQVVSDFNDYHRNARVPEAAVEAMHRAHMGLYFSFRFKIRGEFIHRGPFKTAPSTDQGYLARTQAAFIERLASMRGGNPLDAKFDPGVAAVHHRRVVTATGAAPGVADSHLFEVAERINVLDVSPAIERFCERYIHDSMAGFIGMGLDEYAANNIGIVKFRTVFKGND